MKSFKPIVAPLGLGLALLAAGSTLAATPPPETRAQKDKIQSDCNRGAGALKRVETSKSDIQRLYLAFDANDPLRAKLDAVVTQLNDAETTLRTRTRDCGDTK